MRKKIIIIVFAALCLAVIAARVISSVTSIIKNESESAGSGSSSEVEYGESVPDFIMPTREAESAASSEADMPQDNSATAGSSSAAISAATDGADTSESTVSESPAEKIDESIETAASTDVTASTAATASTASTASATAVTAATRATTTATAAVASETAEPTVETGDSGEAEIAEDENILLTTNDALRQVRFEFTGHEIYFTGSYSGDSVKSVYIRTSSVQCYDLVSSWNSFKGSVYTASLKDGYHVITIELSGGGTMNYVFEVEGGMCRKLSTDELPYDANLRTVQTPLELSEQGVLSYITTSGGSEKASEILAEVKALSDEICSGISGDYEKARALAEWVARNMYYDSDAAENGVTEEEISLEFVLEYHRSVCFGWSNFYAALCAAQGIECYVASGSTVNNCRCFLQTETADEASHSWNMVRIDGRDIWVDTVWCSSNKYKNGSYNAGSVDFQFFDITSEILSYDHRIARFESREYY